MVGEAGGGQSVSVDCAQGQLAGQEEGGGGRGAGAGDGGGGLWGGAVLWGGDY